MTKKLLLFLFLFIPFMLYAEVWENTSSGGDIIAVYDWENNTNDISGNGYTGNYNGTVTYKTDSFYSGSYSFNSAVTSWMLPSATAVNLLAASNTWTISFAHKLPSDTGDSNLYESVCINDDSPLNLFLAIGSSSFFGIGRGGVIVTGGNAQVSYTPVQLGGSVEGWIIWQIEYNGTTDTLIYYRNTVIVHTFTGITTNPILTGNALRFGIRMSAGQNNISNIRGWADYYILSNKNYNGVQPHTVSHIHYANPDDMRYSGDMYYAE